MKISNNSTSNRFIYKFSIFNANILSALKKQFMYILNHIFLKTNLK